MATRSLSAPNITSPDEKQYFIGKYQDSHPPSFHGTPTRSVQDGSNDFMIEKCMSIGHATPRRNTNATVDSAPWPDTPRPVKKFEDTEDNVKNRYQRLSLIHAGQLERYWPIFCNGTTIYRYLAYIIQDARMKKQFLLIFLLLSSSILTFLVWPSLDGQVEITGAKYEKRGNRTIILAWNKFFDTDPFLGAKANCRRDNCIFTEDRSQVVIADVVAFHSRDTVDLPNQKYRSPNQIYLFWTMEATKNAGNFGFPKNYFNRTMSTSPSADIPLTYSRNKFIKKLNSSNPSAYPSFPDAIISNKSSGIFALISNCDYVTNHRTDVLDEISRFYPVDLKGACAPDLKSRQFCPKHTDCTDRIKSGIEAKYFHFVMENSDCDGYITEKTYSRLGYNSIPIAAMRQIYEKSSLPNSAFIFLDDFGSAEEVARHLRYLENNSTAYKQYFKWREEYQQVPYEQDWCALCASLVRPSSPLLEEKIIHDVYSEYMTCRYDSAIPLPGLYFPWPIDFRRHGFKIWLLGLLAIVLLMLGFYYKNLLKRGIEFWARSFRNRREDIGLL
ncbi:unnamed protein product, partial [Mesorhabditis spiculigera]